ncbi:MAG: ATP-binding protein [Marmoricola sp.]
MTRLSSVVTWLFVLGTTVGSVQITMHTGVPAVWAANALAACALLRFRSAHPGHTWWLLLPLAWILTTAGNALGGRPLPSAEAFGVVNMAEVAVLVLVVSWRTEGPYTLASWTELRRTVIACGLGAVTFAAGSAVVLETLGTGAEPAWAAWSVGSHLAGSLVLLPLAGVRSPVIHRPAGPEVAGQVLVLVAALTAAFTNPFSGNAAFLLIPALLWAAARFPAAWAHCQLAAVGFVVIGLTLADVGPFVAVRALESTHAMTTSVQTFLVLTALLILAFSTSVAAERAAVARYLRHEAGMGRLLESAEGTAFIATDVHGRITLFNSGAERMLGYDSTEVVGTATPLWFHLPEEVASRAVELGVEFGFAVVLAEAGEDQYGERQWTWVAKDGTHRTVALSPAVVRDHWGRPTAYLAIARDVTESLAAERALRSALTAEREVNQRLRELDAAKNDFVANVSHELRTPLATIIGCTELLEDGLAGPLSDVQADLVEKVNRNSARLLGLIEDLLTLNAVAEGHFAITASAVDLCAVVRRAVSEEVTAEDAARVTLDLPGRPVPIGGDADQLVRLVGNLVGNACKFTPTSGRIRTAVHTDATGVRLEVSDTGVGIAWEDQPLVFERFFRSRSSREAEVPGTGLGLSIVRSIAEAHGAAVDCVSTPGQGSTFSVTFPARSPVALVC